jgi:hypothetical protein
VNAISPIAAVGHDEGAQRLNARWDADVFRSRLIEKFAEIEAWAVGRLRAGQPEKKMQPTLGLRLGAVKSLTESHPRLFRQAATAAKLIDELKPFQELRSALAHSTLAIARLPDGLSAAIFDRADADREMPWQKRTTLLESDFRQIISEVSDLANQLKQQLPPAS